MDGGSQLRSLCLDNNYVGDHGAGRLAEALRSNATLQALGLRLNNVGDMAIFMLGAALRANPACALRHLDVSQNVVDAGVRRMLESELELRRGRKSVAARSQSVTEQ